MESMKFVALRTMTEMRRWTGQPPSVIYFLSQKSEVIYVGQSKNLHSRLVQHRRDKKFDDVHYFEVYPHDHPDDIEHAFIKAARPKINGFDENKSKLGLVDEIFIDKYGGQFLLKQLGSSYGSSKN